MKRMLEIGKSIWARGKPLSRQFNSIPIPSHTPAVFTRPSRPRHQQDQQESQLRLHHLAHSTLATLFRDSLGDFLKQNVVEIVS
jgi:hypothetical protein